MNAKNTMIELAEMIYCSPNMPWITSKLKPGESFNKLSEEIKTILRELKSDDLKNVRWPLWI